MIFEKSWRRLGICSQLRMVVIPLLPAIKVRTYIRKPFLYMLIIFIFDIRHPFSYMLILFIFDIREPWSWKLMEVSKSAGKGTAWEVGGEGGKVVGIAPCIGIPGIALFQDVRLLPFVHWRGIACVTHLRSSVFKTHGFGGVIT